GDVIISQYYEGASYDKWIEITNVGASSVDLSTYYLARWANTATPSGSSTAANQLSGDLPSGSSILYNHSSAVLPSYATGISVSSVNFNGDDPMAITTGGTDWSNRVDCIYSSGTWGSNKSFYRKSTITSANTNQSVLDGSGEWIEVTNAVVNNASSSDTEYLGYHVYTPAGGNSLPTITNVTQIPSADITSTTTVSVSADVTDSDGTITNVELHWGLTSGSLGNTIAMPNSSGDTYTTTSDIPAQSDGAIVYYEVEATDDEPEISTSAEYDYTVNDPATTALPYSEVFTTDLGDCYTYNVSGATKEWVWDGGSAYMSGYNSGDTEEDWLVLPGINFDNYLGEVLLFDTSYNYGSDDLNNYLKLYYSTNYTGIGDPTSSAWTEISFTLPTATNTWTSSGILDLSAISGTSVYIAFKYHYEVGSYRNWDVDNISIAEVSNFAPVISNIAQTPASNIGTSTTVSVSADVTDSDGTISLVELHWGLTSGSLGTTISMSLDTGSTYVTDTDIPVQSEGTTVYYEIYAVDDEPESSTSAEYDYFVTDAVAPGVGDLFITEVCGDGVDGDNGNNNCFMEIYNTSSSTLSLANIQARYYNSNPGNPTQTVDLSGTIAPGGYIIITQDETNFNTTYSPITADFIGSAFYFNGGVDGVDIYDATSDAEILDSFNDNGTVGSPWTWDANNVFERTSTGDGATVTNWTENTTGLGTPGAENESPLPVTLTDFSTAIIMNKFVQISWTTQTESSINAWNLYRSIENSPDQILLYSEPGTNTTQPYTYIFEDHEVNENVIYYYYLEATEYDGTSNMWGPISAMLEGSSTPELPTTSMLEINYPNPFNPSTTINCDIKEGEEGALTIYNARGQLIERQILNAGEHIIKWDGTAYGSGIYLYKLETDSYTKTRKMIMIK
ncbi:MAG: lamin tail domain-containing protein, partial [Candidatus Cloacimonetes bacterium]|nr:lamin tail domain-containing protein [Candidatus Cloacimonadota bacterium]